MKVEMMCDEKAQYTKWFCTRGSKTVVVHHNHTTLRTPVFHIERVGRTGVPTGENAIVSSRDFGDVLRVVRDMLGVKP